MESSAPINPFNALLLYVIGYKTQESLHVYTSYDGYNYDRRQTFSHLELKKIIILRYHETRTIAVLRNRQLCGRNLNELGLLREQ